MATSFQSCLDDLAALLSVSSIDRLPPNEAAQVRNVLSEAYRECFLRPDGNRSRWSERAISLLYRDPIAFTATLTQGSCAFAASTPLDATAAGSVVLINGVGYTFVGAGEGGTFLLLDQWPHASGTFQATFYTSAKALPAGTLDVVADPCVLGGNQLECEPGIIEATPEHWRAGTPELYAVDPSALGDGSHPPRLVLYPVPAASCTVRLRIGFVPDGIGSDITAAPALPAGTVNDILLPIARMKLVMVAKRYAGENRGEIIAAGRQALLKLDAVSQTHRARTAAVEVSEGY